MRMLTYKVILLSQCDKEHGDRKKKSAELMEWKRRDNSRRGEVTHQAAHPESWIQAVCLPQKKENLEHKQNVLNKQIIKRNEKINDETGIHTTSLLHIAIILQHKQIPNDKKEKILYENSNYV